MNHLTLFLQKTAALWWRQLPMFVMLVLFSSAPAYFFGGFNIKSYLLVIFTQTVLPAMLLCAAADYKRWIWWIIFIVANLCSFVELTCFGYQGCRISTMHAILLAQTNSTESSEFISTISRYLTKAALIQAAIAAFFIIWQLWWRRSGICGLAARIRAKAVTTAIGAAIALSMVYSPIALYYANKDFNYIFRVMNKHNTVSTTWYVYPTAVCDILFNPELNGVKTMIESLNNTEVTVTVPRDSLSIILVVGESFNRGHSSLYGYSADTNPLMGKELADSSLIIYDDIICYAPLTSVVYKTILSTYDRALDKKFEEYPLLPGLLKKAGYTVSLFDNQSPLSANKEIPSVEINYFLLDETNRSLNLDNWNDECLTYDGDLIAAYPPSSFDTGSNNFIIYHLMGQHYTYRNRYPDSFARFSANDYARFTSLTPDERDVISEYDNATLYNDYVLGNIISHLRDRNAVMIYVPDHGEELYEYRLFSGHAIDAPLQSVRFQNEVPVMIWYSDRFAGNYPDIVKALRANTHKALFNNDIAHTILDIAGITTDTHNAGLSLLSDSPGRQHRRILSPDIDYDDNYDEIHSINPAYK